MITEKEIEEFVNQFNYDLRISNNGRWIDQKCTPDVLNIVADCVFHYVNMDSKKEFTKDCIWRSEYAEENVRDIFNKPELNEAKSESEYDKFFAQPLEMLANANVLNKTKKGNKNFYTIQNFDVLEYISLRERNSLLFIRIYCEKVLKDSELWSVFDEFFTYQNKFTFDKMKDSYEKFIIKHTKINGVTEVRRIFTKVLNPIACNLKKLGTTRGNLSKNIITFSSLMYNQENFRDINIDKPKGMTRTEWDLERSSQSNKNYFKYQSQKAKRFLRLFNEQYRDGKSEFFDDFANGKATQIHHIFPEHLFPEISAYLENLIALTPTQHLTKAHPDNNTKRIDTTYQELLLKAKIAIIEENINNIEVETIYSFANFIEVLNTGFLTEYDVDEIGDNNFPLAMQLVTHYYAYHD